MPSGPHVPMSLCPYVSMSPCPKVPMFPSPVSQCSRAAMSPCPRVPMSPCLRVFVSPCPYVSMSPCLHVSMSLCLRSTVVPVFLEMENGKGQFPFVCCKKKETANFRLFAANRNGKRKFAFLGRQTINVNQLLLFQYTCPSTV
jgi:hypothetical protein